MKKITDALNTLGEAVAKSVATLTEEAARLEAAAHCATGGKVMPITACTLPGPIRSCSPITSFGETTRFGMTSWRVRAQSARQLATTARAELEAQHAANIEALENNKRVTQQVHLIMGNLGIEPSRVSFGFATKSARKMTKKTVYAGYISDLADVCKTSDGYDECLRSLASFEARISEYEQNEAAKEAALEREKERENKARTKLTTLGALAHKYSCEPDTDSIIAAMGERCKYFHLGYWLKRNRADWNEGPQRAQRGLDGFTVESPLDQEIFEDIQRRIVDWGGDGRTFRDSPFGYDFLFTKVDTDLMNDYRTLCSRGLLED